MFLGIDQVFPSEDQFSFVHMKVFSLHNHLFSDPWSENSVYFLDSSFKINKANVHKDVSVNKDMYFIDSRFYL